MTVYTAKQVASAFTSAVAKFMNDGYIISPFTESGSYSSVKSHIDLIKPNDSSHMLRVWMVEKRTRIGDRCYQLVDIMGPMVKRYNVGHVFDGNIEKSQVIWPDTGETIYENLFYKFEESDGRQVFSDSLEEAAKLVNLQIERSLNKPDKNPFDRDRIVALNKLSPSFIDSIMKRVNSLRGFKRAKANCIEYVQIYKRDNKLSASIKYCYNDKVGFITLR